MSRPRRAGERRRADADRTPGAGGAPSRRGRGNRGTAPGRPRSGPAAGAGQARLAAANGGSWRRFGGWAEGSPSPHGCPTEGRREQAHNKETTATEAGAAVLGPSADLGTKELRGWGWFDAPSPNPLQPLWARRPGPGLGDSAAVPGPARDGRAVAPRLLPLTINHRICHRFSCSPAQSLV